MTENDSVYGDISPVQRIAIVELAQGASRTDAAQKVGVSQKTLYRWLRSEAFQSALQQQVDEVSEQLTRKLAAYSQAALGVTLRLMLDDIGSTPPSVRLMAASKILDHNFKARELDLLQRRISRLEQFLAEQETERDEEDGDNEQE